MNFLELTHIQKSFSGTVAVKDFNLKADQGEFISFLGPSGCGKTTTLRMIAGFEIPNAGSITLMGKDVTFISPNKRNVGMVFQTYALFPNMTVSENIAYGLMVARKPRPEIAQRVAEMLSLIHMETYITRYPAQLSGGQQQRVALARALAYHPQVLLLDEPLSALDAKIRLELRQEIRRIQRKLGITTIYVTHDQEEALSLSDRVVVMNQGCIEQIGQPFEIYNYPATEFVASFVGHLNLIPVQIENISDKIVCLADQTIRVSRISEKFSPLNPRLAVRPEEVAPGTVENQNNLQGKVESITYLGSIVRVRVDVNGVLFSLDMFNEHNLLLPNVGEPFAIHFPVEACWLL